MDQINEKGTFLPKSILHEDLDRGFLDFVKNDLEVIVEGKKIPVLDIIITTQNWSQYVETWEFQNTDKNPEPPFITVVRRAEPTFGKNPSLRYNIPNRRQYFTAAVPTWDGTRKGLDIYTIPQPVPVDMSYTVKIVCNRMREVNAFNKKVLTEFASRQGYMLIKGHYIPIVADNITDESIKSLEKRRYYIQSYDMTSLGFLIDEDEFEVKPAITRTMALMETKSLTNRRREKETFSEEEISNKILFEIGVSELIQKYYSSFTLKFHGTNNITGYEIYVNGDYYGSNLNSLMLNGGDVLRIVADKTDADAIGSIIFEKIFS